MTNAHSARTILSTPSFENLLETLDRPSLCSAMPASECARLSYRASPDGSVTMGTDPLSGQVVLIVQNTPQCWEIALPPKIARFAKSESEASLAAAQQVAEQAFGAYWASKQS
ncbi:MAG: hypothetical protein ACOY2B_05215 [Pseudomonadota bacterium]